MPISNIIRNLRIENDLSQLELATKLSIPRYIVSNWEQGRTEPSMQDIINLSNFFDVSINFLFGLEDDLGYPTTQKKAAASPQPPSVFTLSNDEQLLLDYYRRLAPKNKTMLFNLMKNIFEEARDLPTEQVASWIGTVN